MVDRWDIAIWSGGFSAKLLLTGNDVWVSYVLLANAVACSVQALCIVVPYA